jgi:hypothetical protein
VYHRREGGALEGAGGCFWHPVTMRVIDMRLEGSAVVTSLGVGVLKLS